MVKRKIRVLCFALAAALLLCGCGPALPADNPPVGDREPSPPAPTAVLAADPTPALTPAPDAFTAEPLEGDTSYTFHETTYFITAECCAEDDWPTTRLLAEENNGRESAAAYDGYFVSAYYCETGRGACILLTTDIGVSESVTTYVLDASSLTETDSVGGSVKSITDGAINVSCHVDMLGTYSATREYTLNEDFTLELAGDGLYDITENDFFLETTQKLPVQMLENGQYKDGTLAAGAELCVTATDAESVVHFKTRDGRAGRLSVTVENWEILIDGKLAEEWFVELPYAG